MRISIIHKAFCKARKIKYSPKDIEEDLRNNCHEVATRLVELLEKEGIPARTAYGFFHGKSVMRPGLTFHRHGWAIVGKEIWDPTRWAFEGVTPYIFKGKAVKHPEYDEGMRRFKQAMRTPCPDAEPDAEVFNIRWSVSTYVFLSDHLKKDPSKLTAHQLHWLANTDYILLGENITEIYNKIIELNMSGFIPMDYRKWWEHNK